jgi:hypothetical protein
MLSSALVGVLRVGAVVLTAGGLGTGVYFLAPAGEGEDAGSRLQAPEATATVDARGPLTPPEEGIVPPRPIPTFPPASVTPRPIDTANWQTYISPLGFTIKYPPGWRLEPDHGYQRLLNPIAARQIDSARAQGLLDMVRVSGMAEVTIIVENSQFDTDLLIRACEETSGLESAEEPPDRAQVVTFAGRPAVRCVQAGLEPSGLESIGLSFSVEFPPGRATLIGGAVTSPAPGDLAIITAILSSFTLQMSP